MQRLLILLIVLILALDTAFAEDGINPGVSGMSDKYAAAQIMLSERKYDEAIAAFEALSGYEDSGKYIFYAKCLKAGTAGDYEIAASCFMTLGDFKDAKLNAIYYDALSLEKKALYEQAGEKYKTIYFFRDSEIRYLALEDKINARDYDTAITMLEGGDTAKAMEMLEPLAVKNYADSNMYLMLAQYKQAEEKEKSGNLKEAYECYASLVKKGYDDPNALRLTWYKDMYAQAEALLEAGDYERAHSMFYMLYAENMCKECYYRYAKQCVEYGYYEEAYSTLAEIPRYSDVSEYILANFELFRDVGSTFYFGEYEQDNDLSNGKEPIEWRVITIEDGQALLMSEYLLDVAPYNEVYENVTWETSSIRQWLNGEFLNTAFSDSEKEKIRQTTVKKPDYLEYDDYVGKDLTVNDTQDQVFLFSYGELHEYFGNYYDSHGIMTKYAEIKEGHKYLYIDYDVGVEWWFRDNSSDLTEAGVWYIEDRQVFYNITDPSIGVRPVIWVDISGSADYEHVAKPQEE